LIIKSYLGISGISVFFNKVSAAEVINFLLLFLIALVNLFGSKDLPKVLLPLKLHNHLQLIHQLAVPN